MMSVIYKLIEEASMSQQTRIVITGMGIASPLGCGIEPVWQRLLAGKSGLRRLPDEILAAHARREEARRAVDKLLRMR